MAHEKGELLAQGNGKMKQGDLVLGEVIKVVHVANVMVQVFPQTKAGFQCKNINEGRLR